MQFLLLGLGRGPTAIGVVWCKSADGKTNVASHTTTYHLRYVDVPEQINLEKHAGEPLTIELQQTSGKPKVVRAY